MQLETEKTMTIGDWLVMGLNTVGDIISTKDKVNLQ